MTRNGARWNSKLAELDGSAASVFLLHREPLLLLDRLVESRDDYTICEWDAAEGGPFVRRDSGIPAYVGIEFMAQCVAVHAGARARIEGHGPPLGFLLGTRHFRSSVDRFRTGKTYRAKCTELIRDSYGMASYDCEILAEGGAIAEARLSVFEKEPGRTIGNDRS